jgi:hypothetical protein
MGRVSRLGEDKAYARTHVALPKTRNTEPSVTRKPEVLLGSSAQEKVRGLGTVVVEARAEYVLDAKILRSYDCIVMSKRIRHELGSLCCCSR